MSPTLIITIIEATMRLSGVAIAAAPKVAKLIQDLRDGGENITIEDLEAAVARCEALNEEIQKA